MGKIFVSAVAFFILIGGVLVFEATRSTKSLIVLPSELMQYGQSKSIERIRVRGKVADPVEYQLEPELKLKFLVADPDRPEVLIPVVYNGLKPDMFQAGRDVLIDGDYSSGAIQAIKVLTQCPSKYEPETGVTKQ